MIGMKHALAGALALGAMAATAGAQCRPPASSHEARLLAFYEAPPQFSMGEAPDPLAAGSIRVGGEIMPVPSPDPVLTHPEFCYQNSANNTKLAPVFARPRVTVGLPLGFALEGSYVPPVSVSNARVTVGSVALSRTQELHAGGIRSLLELRVHGTIGRVRGPITCSRDALQLDRVDAPCYGTEPSNDSFDPNSFGGEAALGTRVARLGLYAGAGVNWLRPHFQAGFTDATGYVDRTTVDVSLVRGVAFGGATLHLGEVAMSSQLYVIPSDATIVRLAISYRVR
jgi:hypothetical protein